MKRIKKTLMAGVLACVAFNAHAEVNPWSVGVKGGGSISSATGYGNSVHIGDKKADSPFFDNFWVFGGGYAEYAFDYVGLGADVTYIKRGGTLTGKEGNKDSNSTGAAPSINMSSHNIGAELRLCVYPLGREAEEGIAKLTVGGAAYLPFATTYKIGNRELVLTDSQKGEEAGVDVALTGAVGYEFPIGLALELKYGYGLMNRFKLKNDNKGQTIFSNATGLKKVRAQHATLAVAYNIMSLFSE